MESKIRKFQKIDESLVNYHKNWNWWIKEYEEKKTEHKVFENVEKLKESRRYSSWNQREINPSPFWLIYY